MINGRTGLIVAIIIIAAIIPGCGRRRSKTAPLPAASIKVVMEKAKAAANAGNYEEAIKIYENAVKSDPYNSDARSSLAEVLMKAAEQNGVESPKKLNYMERALALEPASEDLAIRISAAFVEASNELERQGDLEGAREVAGRGLGLLPGDHSLLARTADLSASAHDAGNELESRIEMYNLGHVDSDNLLRLIELAREKGEHDLAGGFLAEGEARYPDDSRFDSLKTKLSEPEALKLLQQAEKLYKKGEVRGVVDAVEAVRLGAPEVLEKEHFRMLFMSYEKLGMIDSALSVLNINEDSIEGSAEYMIAASRVLMISGKTEKAGNLLQQAREQYPEEKQIYFAEAALLERLGKAEEAAGVIDQILQKNPDDVEALEKKGFLYFRARAYTRAVQMWQKALQSEPDNATLHFNVGAAMASQRRWVAAINSYREAVRLDSENPKYYYYLFVSYKETKDFTSMETVKNRILELDRNGEYGRKISQIYDISGSRESAADLMQQSDDNLYKQGLNYARAGHFDDAVRMFSTVVSRTPNHIDAILNLGNVYMAKGDYPRAAALYIKARVVKEDVAATHQFLGHAYAQLGLPEDARRSYEESLKLERNNIEIQAKMTDAEQLAAPDKPYIVAQYLAIADALIQENANEEAYAMINKAKLVSPGDYRIKLSEAALFERSRLLEKAEALYREAYQMEPDSELAASRLGFYLSRHGNSAEAEGILGMVVAGNPSDIATGVELARLYREDGELEKSRQLLQSLKPSSPAEFAAIQKELQRFDGLFEDVQKD